MTTASHAASYVHSDRLHHAGIRELFLNHFLSAWGDRMWQFATPILFVDIYGGTLLPSAVYAIAVYATCAAAVPAIGAWVDRSERLHVMRMALVVDNVCIISTSMLLVLLANLAATPANEAARHAADASADHGMAGSAGWDGAAVGTATGAPDLASDGTGGGGLGTSWHTLAVFTSIIVLSCAGEVMNQAQTLAIERDWVVQVCQADSTELTRLNSWMQRIDLAAKVLAPAALGVALGAVAGRRARVVVGAALVGGWNAASFPLELLLTYRVYRRFEHVLEVKEHEHDGGVVHRHRWGARSHTHVAVTPMAMGGGGDTVGEGTGPSVVEGGQGPRDQQHPGPERHVHKDGVVHTHGHGHADHDHAVDEASGEELILVTDEALSTGALCCGSGNARQEGAGLRACAAHFALFARHRVAGASVAYCLLYMTVLDNGSLMTSYLQWRGVPPALLGVSRGLGATVGLIGTAAFPRATACFSGSYEKVGLLAIWAFWLLLAPAGVVMAVAGECRASDMSIIASMVVSRAALWSFDLAETQVMQEYTQERLRGTVNGVQTSLYQACYVLIQAGGLVFHRPEQFAALVSWSMGAVLLAAMVYSRWFVRVGRARSLQAAHPALLAATEPEVIADDH